MSFTVVPLHNLDLPPGSQIPFGPKFTIEDIPEWLRKDEQVLDDLSRRDRTSFLKDRHALVSVYEADSYGYSDPDWKGVNPRGIQDLRYQSAFLANIAIWLIQPSMVCFTNTFHALTCVEGRDVDPPIVYPPERQGPFYCHPNEHGNTVSAPQLVKASAIFEVLDTVPRNNAVWSGLRAVSGALASYYGDYRYPLFWQALESLFGSDTNDYNVSHRLKERISCFIAPDYQGRREIRKMVERCYQMRCEIVHGRWSNDPVIDNRMSETESIVRTVLINLARDPAMLAVFASEKRNAFLQAWELDRNLARPPLPSF